MDSNFLKICQFNVESLNSKKPLLITFLDQNDIDICLLNETHLKQNHNFKITGYNFIYQHGLNGRGGVGILIRNNFKYTTVNLPFYEDLQSASIVLKTDIGNLSILCTYSPPRPGRFKSRQLKQIINSLPKPIILSGDLNAHHVAFGCLQTKPRGTDVYDLVDECDLCILNSGAPTTVGSLRNSQSSIDITCVSPQIAPLCHWSVSDDPMGSYHYPTFTFIELQPQDFEVGQPIERFLYDKADWKLFASETEKAFRSFSIDYNEPLSTYDKFCVTLNTVKESCIPKLNITSPTIRKKPVPWWDNECLEAVKKSKAALNFYRTHPSVENFIEYKKIDAIKKKLLREKKKNGWRSLCESFNRQTPVTVIWNYIRRFKRASSVSRPKNSEWIPSFLDKYAPDDPPEKYIDTNLLNSYFTQEGNSSSIFLSNTFTWQEFQFALKSRKDTTPGLDDIPYKILGYMHKDVQKILLDIYNLLWTNNLIPNSWKTQCIIPILKPEKPESDYNSYRPISLSSCVGKIFEYMLKVRLDWYVESNNILPKEQYGFRKGKSCVESFVALLRDIKDSFQSFSSTVCAFLDVQGAFDNVDPTILAEVLIDIGVPGKVCEWIFKFLFKRTMYVKFNNILHGPRHIYKGTMQGATISPLLYSIYTSQLCKYLISCNVKFLQYADDIVVYSSHKDVNIAVNILNKALEQVYNYYTRKLKLWISLEKSTAMIFSKSDPRSLFNVKIHNNSLNWVSEQKFLGIYLDNKLKFENHIQQIIKKACGGLNIIRSLAGVHWGSDPKTLSMLYKSLVRSHFDYSTLAYYNCSYNLLRKLDVIQNKALRVITGAMCSTPIHIMEAEACIPPLTIIRLKIAERFCLKVFASKNDHLLNRILPIVPSNSMNVGPYTNVSNIISRKLPELLRIMINIYLNFGNYIFRENHWPMYNIEYNAYMHDVTICEQQISNQNDLLNTIDNEYRIYTDGSKTLNIVTSAYYDPQEKVKKCLKLANQCSIFTAECYAIYRALLYISSINQTNFLILTDSLSVLTALKNRVLKFNTNYLIFKIKQTLYHMYNNSKNVKFIWVPSHSGITGNEEADAAARGDPDEDHSQLQHIPYTDIHAPMKDCLGELFKAYYTQTSSEKGKWYYDIQKVPPAKPWYHKLKGMSRSFIVTMNRMRFGHCQVKSHLYRLKMVNTSLCDCGVEEETLDHLVLRCGKHNIARLLMCSEISEITTDKYDSDSDNLSIDNLSLKDLLQKNILYGPLYSFLKNVGKKL